MPPLDARAHYQKEEVKSQQFGKKIVRIPPWTKQKNERFIAKSL
jgi:hypothetical protein